MTEVTKFAPGPWHTEQAQRPPHHLMVINARGFGVGMVFKRTLTDDELCFANARLIEQAPALFDAAQALRAALLAVLNATDGKTLQAAGKQADAAIEQADAVHKRVEGRR